MTEAQIWITYRTPNLRAQRFYTVKPLELDLVPTSGKHRLSADVLLLNGAISADPTRLKEPVGQGISLHAILDYVSFNTTFQWSISEFTQVNIAPVVDQLVHGKIISSSLLMSEVHLPAKTQSLAPDPSNGCSWSSVKRVVLILPRFLGAVCNAPMPPVYPGATLFKDISATRRSILECQYAQHFQLF